MKKRLKITLVLLLVMLVVLVAALLFVVWQHHDAKSTYEYCMRKPGSSFFCDINLEPVSDPAAQEKGLGGRDSMPEDQGMMFEFADSEVRCFWMKDMNFNIDILWLDEKSVIVAKEINVSPDTYPKNFCPEQPAWSVIELNANVAKDWAIGTALDITAPVSN